MSVGAAQSAPGRSAPVGVLLALLSAAAFATLAVWARLADAVGLPTETLLTWRFALAALALLLLPGTRAGLPWRTRLLMLGFGAWYTLQTALYFGTLSRITAGTSALLLYLAPVFVVLLAWLMGRRPSRMGLAALSLTVAGLAVVIGLPGDGDRDGLGVLLGVCTGAAYAAYLLGSERLLGALPPLTVTAHVSAGAALGFALLGLLGGTLGVPSSAGAWGVVAGAVVFPTLVALPALFGALSRLGATRTSILATTEPIWTVLLAALLLGEAARPVQLAGGLLILLGAALAQLHGPRGPTSAEIGPGRN
jgi:drug/metabolite transporter (DMT)-like permease